MGTLGNPKTWLPYMNTKDCSQGFCSLYCPQWCYIIFPPPPPFSFPDDSSAPKFSPLVIAIIGVLASGFLLVSYYALISKYCRNMESTRMREDEQLNEEELEGEHEHEHEHDPSNHEPWHVNTSTGLEEALIRLITVFKYKKGNGLIEGTDCSVCLSEFQEDESLRLLPKCSHAFHVTCIDTWLKSHSNCPLCRANIMFANASPAQLPPPVPETPPSNESSVNMDNAEIVEDLEMGVRGEENPQSEVPKTTPLRTLSDLGNSGEQDSMIQEYRNRIRRSVSMDYSCQSRCSIADVLRMSEAQDFREEECTFQIDVGSSKHEEGEMSKFGYRNRVLNCVMSPVPMKRSFSSGRFFLTKHGRGRKTIIPL